MDLVASNCAEKRGGKERKKKKTPQSESFIGGKEGASVAFCGRHVRGEAATAYYLFATAGGGKGEGVYSGHCEGKRTRDIKEETYSKH